MNTFRKLSLVVLLSVAGNAVADADIKEITVSSYPVVEAVSSPAAEYLSDALAYLFKGARKVVDTVSQSETTEKVCNFVSDATKKVTQISHDVSAKASQVSHDVTEKSTQALSTASVKVAPAREALSKASVSVASVLASAAAKSGNESWAKAISENPAKATTAAVLATAATGYVSYKLYKLVRYGLYRKTSDQKKK